MEIYNLMKQDLAVPHDEYFRKELDSERINEAYFKEKIV